MVGDHPALDFINTLARPGGRPTEWLSDGDALLRWVAAAGLAPDAVWNAAHQGELNRTAGAARHLRAWWRTCLEQRIAEPTAQPAPAEFEPLNRVLGASPLACEVVADRGGLSLCVAPGGASPGVRALGSIGHAIADLLVREDFARVRSCEGPGCTLMFIDRTKGGTRRWCSMMACGNRAKAAANRARLRDRAAGVPAKQGALRR
jgi:predicted RNA-binding Zn ribbon-like protein